MAGFFNSRSRLARALAANRPGSSTPHSVVVLPSYSVGDSLLEHYGHRIPSLEHRYLLMMLSLPRISASQIVFVTSLAPTPEVLDYYLSLMPPEHRESAAARFHVIEVPDATHRSVSAKLLDRPDLINEIKDLVRGRVAYIEPWNVTRTETRIARRLGLPLNGTAPHLWPLGFKSSGRRLMRAAGVPLPYGFEDVRSVDGVIDAALAIRRERPDAPGVVVKTDNSGTGDGNRILHFSAGDTACDLRAAVESLEPWYLADLPLGAVVEELVVGSEFTSPSVQVDISPRGRVEVLSTHEQVLGGDNGQVYSGCEFPADQAYGFKLAAYGQAVGHLLAEQGALGRLCVDFAATRSGGGRWRVYGLEINLRKSGTTHPYSALRNLAPGRYDSGTGSWIAEDGARRCYRSTDNLVDPRWLGRPVEEVITAIRSAGLDYDHGAGTGVVLHMFCGLNIDGRLGLTAIGTSPEHAEELYEAAVVALSWSTVPAEQPVSAPMPA